MHGNSTRTYAVRAANNKDYIVILTLPFCCNMCIGQVNNFLLDPFQNSMTVFKIKEDVELEDL